MNIGSRRKKRVTVVCSGRLTWLVYIIGAVIGGRVSFASTDEQDAMDGELVCRWEFTDMFLHTSLLLHIHAQWWWLVLVFFFKCWRSNYSRSFVLDFSVLQLMNLTDSRLAQAGNEKLELAMLSFFEQFRKIYIGDQVQKSSKVITTEWRLYHLPSMTGFTPPWCWILYSDWSLVLRTFTFTLFNVSRSLQCRCFCSCCTTFNVSTNGCKHNVSLFNKYIKRNCY